jgi:excisionase family DNA binding protein
VEEEMEAVSKSDQLITVEQAAERHGVSTETIRRRIVAGELPVYRNNQDRRVRLVSIGDLDRVFQPTLLESAA